MDSVKDSADQKIPESTYDETDGGWISVRKRRRGVKVTGKNLPVFEWEQIEWNNLPSTVDQSYTQRTYTLDSKEDVALQKTQNNSNQEQKGKRIIVVTTCPNKVMSSTREEIESDNNKLSGIQAHSKDDTSWDLKGIVQGDSQKNEKDSKDNNQTFQREMHEKVQPIGPGISKQTIAELKDHFRESSMIATQSRDINRSSVPSTFILLPKTNGKHINKTVGAFETFRPHREGEQQKIQTTQDQDEKHQSKSIPSPTCAGSELIQSPEGTCIKPLYEKQPAPSDKPGSAVHVKYDSPTTPSTGQADSGKNTIGNIPGFQQSIHLIPQIEHIKQQIAKEDINFVRFEATDLHGVSRSKTIPARFFQEKVFHGVFMPRSYLELTLNPKDNEVDYISATNYNSDIVLLPDLSTFRVIPWAEKMARVICDSYSISGNPLLTSPRHIVKRQLSQLQESGLSLYSAFSYEFCIYGVAEVINSKTIFLPAATLLNDHDQPYIQQLIDGMYHIGANIESFSSSTGPGQVEISFRPEFGLRVADNAFSFRTGVKELAKKNGYIASFFTETGFYNSGILSHSLWDRSGRRNLFHSGTLELTDIGKNWLSGLLLHSPALSCLVAPGVSCRKRFSKDGKESQEVAHVKWGTNDNSSSYNIKFHGSNGPHIDNNLGSATANPYLVLAATIAAGMDGIRKGLNAFDGASPASTELKSPTIPLSLEDALVALKEDTCIKEAFGEGFVSYFIAMKQYELETEESDTERNKFLEYFI
ncbi:lengsin [Lissotriton helveticus]